MSRRRWVAMLAGLLLLTGCTTIPNSSPQVIRTPIRGDADSPQPSITPEPGEDPQAVVLKFISAAVLAGAQHSASRQFLTTAAARKWQDTSTVILDEPRATKPPPDLGGDRATVVVSGRRVGQLDSAGVYTPVLKNLGKGDQESFTFRLVRTNGQWRIDQLPPGVLVGSPAFNASFNPPSTLYFLNAAADTGQLALVPDLRYTSLTGQAQASWMLTQLLVGPRAELAQSVVSEIPDQVGKPTVQLGDPITVEIPGTNQLDGAGRNALAAQLAFTFYPFEYGGPQLMITDGGRPVRIPDAVGTTFDTNDFNVLSPAQQATVANAYYLRNGAVIDASDDTPLPGLLGQAGELDSVALRDDSTGTVLQAAGVRQGALLVDTDKRLVKVPLPPGEVSRPEWRPHANDVWVGVGDKGAIYRVTPGDAARPVSITSPLGGSLTGQVLAVRFSPDGARIAAVVRAPDGTAAAWVGSISSGTDVRIDSFEPVTPVQLVVSDIAWANETKLSVIAASTASAGPAQVWRLSSDGSQLIQATSLNLPPASPSAIAERDGQPTLISVSGYIWAYVSESKGWSSYPAIKNSNQGGVNPIFAE
jgi:hypothetical protein